MGASLRSRLRPHRFGFVPLGYSRDGFLLGAAGLGAFARLRRGRPVEDGAGLVDRIEGDLPLTVVETDGDGVGVSREEDAAHAFLDPVVAPGFDRDDGVDGAGEVL